MLKRCCDAYGTTRTPLTCYVVTVEEVTENHVPIKDGFETQIHVELSKRGFDRLMKCVTRGTSAVGREGDGVE